MGSSQKITHFFLEIRFRPDRIRHGGPHEFAQPQAKPVDGHGDCARRHVEFPAQGSVIVGRRGKVDGGENPYSGEAMNQRDNANKEVGGRA